MMHVRIKHDMTGQVLGLWHPRAGEVVEVADWLGVDAVAAGYAVDVDDVSEAEPEAPVVEADPVEPEVTEPVVPEVVPEVLPVPEPVAEVDKPKRGRPRKAE